MRTYEMVLKMEVLGSLNYVVFATPEGAFELDHYRTGSAVSRREVFDLFEEAFQRVKRQGEQVQNETGRSVRVPSIPHTSGQLRLREELKAHMLRP